MVDDRRLHSTTRRGAILSAGGLAASGLTLSAGGARGQAINPSTSRIPSATAPPEPPREDPFTLPASTDGSQRLTVPVTIDGRGPFPVIFDTGADHTILSAELAAALMLPQGRDVRVHSISGETRASTARVRRLEVGAHTLSDVSLPVLSRKGLGAPGLLGLDAVADQRVTLDFRKGEMTIRRSKGIAFDPDAVVVRAAARRSGQLLLVDSTVRDEPVFVILDTGAEVTIGNTALRNLETRRRVRRRFQPPLETVRVISVTGDTRDGLVDRIGEITLESVKLRGAPVAWSDLHVFGRFGVADQPAVLLGMDVLRAFRTVEIDFGRREVGFVLPKDAPTE
ncbi:retropepsin-like aspartic protease [soil metagenome]